MPGQGNEKIEIGHRTGDLAVRQGLHEPVERLLAGRAVGDDLGDHRVVPGADLIAGPHAAVDADRARREGRRSGEGQVVEPPGRRQEALAHVFGVDPGLERPAVDRQILLRHGQWLTAGHPQLQLDKIQSGDGLGDGVLDLQAGVHLHEPEAVFAQRSGAVDHELDRSRPGIADGPRRIGGGLAHGRTHACRHIGGRGLLDDLLVSPLQGAVALEQMDDVAVPVAEHLNLDVARLGNVLFNEAHRITEAGLSFSLRAFERGPEIRRFPDQPHALAATARAGLDHHRIADFVGLGGQHLGILTFPVIARDDRHTRLDHQGFGGIFAAHGPDRRSRGADEDEAFGFHRLHKGRVLAEKAIAGVDGFRARALAGVDDLAGLEVAFNRR